MESKRYDSISFGIFLLFVGTVALLTNIGLINWSMPLDFVLRYWPVFIILAGVKLVGNAQLGKFFGLVVDVLFFIAVILGLIFAKDKLFPTTQNQVRETKTISVPKSHFADTKTASYDLSFGATGFTVSDKMSDAFVNMTGPKEFAVDSKITNDKEAQFEIKNTPYDRFFRLPNFGNSQKYELELGATDLVSTLNVSAGASQGDIVFNEIPFRSISTSNGAGELTLELAENSVSKKIDISVGAGKTVLKIKGEHAIRVNYSLGAGELKIKSPANNIDKSFGGVGANGVYETSPLAEIEVQVSIGAGEVEILLD